MAGANDSPAESAGANKSPAESAGANKSDKPKKIEVRPEGAVLSPKLAWLGIFISGFLYWIAFPPMDFWPAALFVWFPFRMALEGRTPKQAAKMGIVAGTVMVFLGFYWLVEMLQVFSGFPLPLCLFFALVVCAYQGGRFAMLGWVHARMRVRGYGGTAAFVFAFIASEMVFPLLFPWSFGVTTNKAIVFQQIADLGGPMAVSLPLMLFSLALAEIAMGKLRALRNGQRGFAAILGNCRTRTVIAGVGALLFQLGYGALRIWQIDAKVAAAPTVRVGMVQGNLGLKQKRREPLTALQRHKRATRQLVEQGAEMVVWSESTVAQIAREPHEREDIKRNISFDLGVPTIIGTLVGRHENGMDWMFNTAVSTDRDGNVTARYDKHFLLMFGEYLPLGRQFPILHQWSPHSGRFTPGESLDPLLLDIGPRPTREDPAPATTRHEVTTLICYEDILPGFTNDAIRTAKKPELIVNMTNDAWFGDTAEPWEHLALAKGRAVEHRRYLIRSTNSGVSAIVDPLGRIVTQTGLFTEETSIATVRWLSDGTVYEVVGDKLWYLLSALALLACFARRPEKWAFLR